MYQVRKIGDLDVSYSFESITDAIEYLNAKYNDATQFEIRNPKTGETMTWGKQIENSYYSLIECLDRLYYTSKVNNQLTRKDAYMRLKTHIENEGEQNES